MGLQQTNERESVKMLLTYEEMSERAFEFYNDLQINIPKKYVALAVRSLTMPQYAKEYKDKYGETIGDHTALATVGDAVCGAFLMLDRYTDEKTKKELTAEKKVVTNEHLNLVGEKILKDRLFAKNNDLESKSEKKNKKAYATAFEAVIGFIALLDKNQNTNNADRILKEQLSNV